ncbi:cobalt ABC transporter permease [Breoghania sp.]|uniref:cobalt ABC transporter permease n=1 Tax=Breoghania sp. TaxID=2065378 RepID=UPI0026136EA1|nr:cobalt ABC transporter permease [Breoghania sp.]MDJ0931504.1 cobalt ABC transporter permease [Breoghania sp.]
MKTQLAKALAGIALLLFVGNPAWAHKMIASVYATGDHIEGEIGFSNGEMAKNAEVDVLDEESNKLAQVKTDEDGFFTYKPTKRIVHIFHANLGAGHVANARMEVEELPDIAGAAQPKAASKAPAPQTNGAPAAQPVAVTVASLSEEEKVVLAKLIHQEVKPLYQEVLALKEKNDFQLILGGIGYIAGLFGLGFYIAARRKLAKD